MSDREIVGAQQPGDGVLWRGTDFSGITLVLGVGAGRLVTLLNEQAAVANGTLVVVDHNLRELRAAAPLRDQGSSVLIQGRPRQIPVLAETVDLLVVNGVMREVPESRLEAMFEELWRALVPGGHLRISDIIEPSEAAYNLAWTERNRIVRKLGKALGRPTALSVNLPCAARASRMVGFEDLALSFLPGYGLTDAWLEETVNAIRNMAGRVGDHILRREILDRDVGRLVAAYAQGDQRAAERFVLQGVKVGDLALSMESSFTEEDLLGPQD